MIYIFSPLPIFYLIFLEVFALIVFYLTPQTPSDPELKHFQ